MSDHFIEMLFKSFLKPKKADIVSPYALVLQTRLCCSLTHCMNSKRSHDLAIGTSTVERTANVFSPLGFHVSSK